MQVIMTTLSVGAISTSHILMQNPKKHLVENKFVTLIEHMACYLPEKWLPFWKAFVSMDLFKIVYWGYIWVPCMLSCFSCVQVCATVRTAAHQAPLSMGFSRQENWSGLLCPPPESLPNPRIQPASLMSPALAGGFFTTSATWETCSCVYQSQNNYSVYIVRKKAINPFLVLHRQAVNTLHFQLMLK